MKNRYLEKDASIYTESLANCNVDLAMRAYTSRLIGQEGGLVLHGGGNTSVKSSVTTLLGESCDVLFIKGSGWDLGTIEPQGFPALDLDYLQRLRPLEGLTDEEMVNQFRTHMLDSTAPNPSIETLVHAFLPHKFIDHTHADAIVTLTNMEQPEERLREVLGDKIGILPWIMPGFPLSKRVVELYEQQPDIEAIILLNHGIFTFGETGEKAYGKMIHYVTLAEEYILSCQTDSPTASSSKPPQLSAELVLPIVRGALTITDKSGVKPFYLILRQDQDILGCLQEDNAKLRYSSGVLTPDHVIRTKNHPLWLDLQENTEKSIAATIEHGLKDYAANYLDYFNTQVSSKNLDRIMLDTKPRVILIPGLGLITIGHTEKAAVISGDIAYHTLLAKQKGSAISPYKELAASHIFDMEYWSLEQVKLGKGSTLPLAGQVALITGGGGAIACGIGRMLLAAGAHVYLCDLNLERLEKVCDLLKQEFSADRIDALLMDVTDKKAVRQGMQSVIHQCGGLDILVPNAGLAHVATLEDLDEEKFRQVTEVNTMGVFQVIQAAIPIFKRQALLGKAAAHIIINSSKNVFAPGAAFGAYSSSKAGAHQLGKIAAMELAPYNVRVNMINADAIFDDHGIPSGLWDVVGPDRMRSRNLDPEGLKEYYRQRNLLKTEVLANHVGNAVVFFASSLTPTTGATLPVDGGVTAAFPR
ncbi:MAG: bifunctional aldolase/short-chain dehydrogenase [Desulfocapsa sp.]|nr:bifunctional aldolase/short-chain dehydrogenase [Desulfocapsa sp.]MBN4048621.1 bifunctional aldolase/short-chain dehydrogenase [bacterium AH-315-N22]MBN4058674.1 bifunctional aldolase/short-chain dehydrogenase [Desulfocapsa sp. AH-315-J15]